MCAVVSGNLIVAEKLLKDYGADIHTQTQIAFGILGLPLGCTPIHALGAVTPSNHREIVNLLLDFGSDPNDSSISGG